MSSYAQPTGQHLVLDSGRRMYGAPPGCLTPGPFSSCPASVRHCTLVRRSYFSGIFKTSFSPYDVFGVCSSQLVLFHSTVRQPLILGEMRTSDGWYFRRYRCVFQLHLYFTTRDRLEHLNRRFMLPPRLSGPGQWILSVARSMHSQSLSCACTYRLYWQISGTRV